MDKAIIDMKTWAEAEDWLARHGYGMGQIAAQKIEWDKRSKLAAKPVVDAKVEEPVLTEKVATVRLNSKAAKK